MKKLILTAAMFGLSVSGYSQQNSPFKSNRFDHKSIEENTQMNISTGTKDIFNQKNIPVASPAARISNCDAPKCVEARKKWYGDGIQNSGQEKQFIGACGFAPTYGKIDPCDSNGSTVPVDMLAFPLLASALALVVAFRKRIAGKLS